MKKLFQLALFVPVVMFVFGCASSPDSLKRVSAAAIGGLRPDQVAVSNVKRGMLNVDWVATSPDGTVYDCYADDMLHQVNAVKRKDGGSTGSSIVAASPAPKQ
ncbi:MAG: hypothetical protein A3B11_00540 [Candidatus Taylorbacteria bacterium RIFCSPLOWO2_01_FULL_44_26]|uniref:PepSY domain-containing protein n=2 Tax=Candidatus Tayloriibacteriota TaxID=1817919 RepID=A0A1G2ML44_9BACT|nr:MAG: hypothetical protein A3D50_00455 [Candidatus Taylorbacteria bacterium RIFCSPHIGHO2_02_FULL_44_12]OHA31172.1 MAG: hypothetical protein A3B11_00540 [Candidatus Taylorbacteria bacterium RIFCSPLOWO2_01_FULL_44_26]